MLQEGASFKRHRLERIAQTYKVVTALDWCCFEGVVGACSLQEERERVTARKRRCLEGIGSDMENGIVSKRVAASGRCCIKGVVGMRKYKVAIVEVEKRVLIRTDKEIVQFIRSLIS